MSDLIPKSKQFRLEPIVTTVTNQGLTPISKARFFEVAAAYGLNRWAASDFWFCRPENHLFDCEDEIRGNFECMKRDKGELWAPWVGRMNAYAKDLDRHLFTPHSKGRKVSRGDCVVCGEGQLHLAHNTEPVE